MRSLRRAATACLVLFLAAPGWADDGFWSGNGPDGGNAVELAIALNGSELYATTRGGLFKSVDGGLSWTRAESGITALVSNNDQFPQLALDKSVVDRLYAGDGQGNLFVTDDGANFWQQTALTSPVADDAVTDIAVHPTDGNIVHITTQSSGFYTTYDGGGNFDDTATGLPPDNVGLKSVNVDPGRPAHVYVGSAFFQLTPVDPMPAAIYRSLDGGINFLPNYTPPTPPGGEPRYYAQGTGFAFGPLPLNRVWAVVDAEVLLSENGGDSWSVVTGTLAGKGIESVTAHPIDNNKAWAVGSGGVFFTADGGINWTPENAGLQPIPGGQAEVIRLILHPDYPTTPTLFVTSTNAGIYTSADNGANWVAINSGLAATNIRTLAVHHVNRNIIYAGFGDSLTPSPALYRSFTPDVTSFITWNQTNTGLPAFQIRSLLIDQVSSNLVGGTHMYAVGRACPLADPADCFGARNGGIYKSVNGGASWAVRDNGLPLVGPISFEAPNVGSVHALVFDSRSCALPPATGPCSEGPLQTLYFTADGHTQAGVDDFRIGKTLNAALAWVSSDNGLAQPINPGQPNQQRIVTGPLGIGLDEPQILYVGTRSLFNPALVPVPNIVSGVYKTIDGGDNWLPVNNGLPRHPGSANTVLDILAIEVHPGDPQILWASTLNAQPNEPAEIYRSADGGQSWLPSSSGVSSPDIRTLLIDRNETNTIYAAGIGTPSNPAAVIKSRDGGDNWYSVSIGLPAYAATALAIDPTDRDVVHAGTTSGVYTLRQLPDEDFDGIPDATEDLAPALATPMGEQVKARGDGNNDGIADKFQGDVGSSVVIFKSIDGKKAPGAAPKGVTDGYFTSDVVAPFVGDCDQAVDVHAELAADFGEDYAPYGNAYQYPHELVRFEIPGCQQGNVVVIFHDANFAAGWSFRAYGPTIPGDDSTFAWYDFSSRATRLNSKTWRLQLSAGQTGSYRPGNNSILFMGGPAFDEMIFIHGFE